MQTRTPFLMGALCAFFLQLHPATPPLLGQTNPVISEFKAVNTGPLTDEDGQFSDWIEIYNPSGSAVSLEGWYLTDNAGNLTKWQFPAVTLEPYSFLVVFASGNNRTNPAAPLHTNFKLDAGGEYLALVKPDMTNVVSAYAPRYAAQNPYSSYGLGMLLSPRATLVDSNSTARVLVPTADIGAAWTGLGFDDAAWTNGPAAIGYDNGTNYGEAILMDIKDRMLDANPSAYVRIPFEVVDPSLYQELKLRLRSDDGFIAYLNGLEVARVNAPPNAAWNSSSLYLRGSEPGVAGESVANFDGANSPYTLNANASSGYTPAAPTVQPANAGSTGQFLRLIADGTLYSGNSIAFDRAAVGTYPLVTADFDFRITDVDNNPADGFAFMLIPTSVYGNSGAGSFRTYAGIEEPNVPGVFAVGFDMYPHASANDVSIHWNGQELQNVTVPLATLNMVNGTFHRCSVKLEFAPDGSGASVTVTITPSINATPGAPIVVINRAFIPGLTAYESRVEFAGRTGGAHMSVDLDNIRVGFTYPSGLAPAEEYDLSRYLALLQPGTNVLAIQGLNFGAASPDFLLAPELFARSLTLQTNARLYFDEATPGALNSSGEGAVVPLVTFSVPSGIHTNASLSVALSSPVPGAVIHYTLNGNVPTEDSPIYSAPLNLSTSALVTARAYAPGYLPSAPDSRCYTLVDSALLAFNSKLPILIIDTLGRDLVTDMVPRANTIVTIIDAKPPGNLAGFAVRPDYQGLAGMEGRGQSSWGFSKRPLNLEIRDVYGRDKKVEFLDFPPGSDFALISQWDDKSFLNDFLAEELYEKMGHYAVRRRLVEVFYNGTMNGQAADPSGRVGANDNVGIYLLVEKIRIDPNRVNIAEPESGEPGDPITGGYIWKKDKDSPGDVNFTTSSGQVLKFHDPKPANLTTNQRAWLVNHINEFESVLYGSDWRDPINGYAKYIAVDSFVDNHWIVEFPKQIDGYRLSNYMYKDRGGKIHMAPIWDWNLSFGNANYLEGGLTNGWYWPLISSMEHIWLRRLLSDPDFNQRIVDRWGELSAPAGPFYLTNLLARIDQMAAYLNEAVARDVTRWPRMSSYLWPNPDGANLVASGTDGTAAIWHVNYATIGSFPAMISEMKKYITGRYNWISQQYLKAPTLSRYSGTTAAPLTMTVSAPTNAVIYYTVDGSDPRLAGGAVSPKALVYSGSFTPPADARIFARTWCTNAWSPPAQAVFTNPSPALAISEIMYHPAPGLGFDPSEYEYIELVNTTSNTIDLGGVRVAGGVDFTFPLGALQPSGTDTTHDFDAGGTAYTLSKLGADPAASVTAGGPAGSFLRLVSQNSTNVNRVAFDQTAAGGYDQVTAEFDFRGQNLSTPQPAGPPTVMDFDNAGSTYQMISFDADTSTPIIMPADAGSSGSFLRMTKMVGSENGGIYFNATADRAYSIVIATFDFRCNGSADGFGFAFLNTANHGTSGASPSFSEEANLAGSIGVGFDIYLNTQSANEPNANHVSLHYNSAQVTAAATPALSLTANKFHRAQVMIQFTGSQALVTVKLSPDVNGAGGATETLYNNFVINGVSAYRGRVAFCARTGGAWADQDVDNINVQYLDAFPVPAGGLSLALLPTGTFGTTGAGSTLATFTNVPAANYVFALDLAMHAESSINDAGLYWNRAQIGSVSVPPATLNFDSGVFHRAKLELARVVEGTRASLTITPDVFGASNPPVTVFSNVLVTGFYPGDLRVELAGRSGGQNLNIDVDNVRVHYQTNAFNALGPGERVLLVKNRAAFESRYGAGLPVAGEYTGQLDNAGDRLIIYGRYGEPILDFRYQDDWHPLTDGYGFSLVATDPSAPANRWDSAANWTLSGASGGAPGQADAAPPAVVPVVVNEVFNSAVAPAEEAIELHNPTTNQADISYWYLTDNFNNPHKYRFGPDTIIPPGGYLVIYESSFNSGAAGSFGLKAGGESVFLFSANAAGQLTGYHHGFDFGRTDPGLTFGRHIISTGDDHLVTQTTPSLGGPNTGPKVGPVVITEVMYHPPDYAGEVDNVVEEFIELRNLTTEPVWLFDPLHPENTWRLRDAVDFTFPANTIIPAGGRVVVVSFDPAADPAQLSAFQARYGVGSAAAIFGPYHGKLDNSSDSVELVRPSPPDPDTGNPDDILVDKVRYADNPPWPLAADGAGFSLHRVHDDGYGNDPANWIAAAPTPLREAAVGAPPAITLQPVSQIAYADTSVSFEVAATGAGPLNYQWRFAGNLLPGATNPVLTLAGVTPAQSGWYQAVVLGPGGAVDSQPARLDVYQAAAILAHPVGGVVSNGGSTNLTVSATGNGLVTYQWRFQDTEIPGATNATLTLTNVQLSQMGEYSAIVRDGIASIATKAAMLYVGTIPTTPPAPASLLLTVGDTLELTGVPNGSPPLAFKWKRSGVDLMPFGEGATNLVITNVNLSHGGLYSFGVSNVMRPSGVFSQIGRQATVVVQPPEDKTTHVGGSVVLRIGVNPVTSIKGQWTFGGSNLVGQTSTNLVLNNVQASQAGVYTFWVTNSVNTNLFASYSCNLTVLENPTAPVITLQPSNVLTRLGSAAQFTAAASGTELLTYQWWFNQTNRLAAATNASLIFTNVGLANVGEYQLVVSNTAGVATSDVAALTVYMPPAITAQPAGTQTVAGATVTFAVEASGADPLSYQWWLGRYQIVPGATNPTLTIPNISPAEAGNYQVVVSSPYGQATSSVANVAVVAPPTVLVQPRSQQLVAGTTVQLYVIASGQAPLGYQWWRNQTELLAGETTPVLTLANVETNTEGAYTVVITNAVGATTSQVAWLTFGAMSPDMDNDGLLDEWEREHGLIVGINDADADADGDGLSNRQEYIAGTDPQQRSSALKVDAIGAVGTTPTMQFQAVSNRAYRVEFRDVVDTGGWNTLTNLPAEPANRTVIVTDPDPSLTNRFYRIIIPSP